MNSNTMTAVAGGAIYPQAMFQRLLRAIRRQVNQVGISPKLVLGGPGAWQVAGNESVRRELGIDHVITGYAEPNAPAVFHDLLAGKPLPAVISGAWQAGSPIPRHLRPDDHGRGRTLARVRVELLVLHHRANADGPTCRRKRSWRTVRTNLSTGNTSIAVLSEDFFRYGAEGLRVNPEALISLLQALRQLPGLRLIQIDHANVASIAQYGNEQLRLIHDLLVGNNRHRYLWVNVGIETASGQLLRDIGAAGKMNQCPPGQWGEHCAEQLGRLCRAGFFPLASLMLGLPGETDEHLRQTLAWVESLGDQSLAIFPMLHAPDRRSSASDAGTTSAVALADHPPLLRFQLPLRAAHVLGQPVRGGRLVAQTPSRCNYSVKARCSNGRRCSPITIGGLADEQSSSIGWHGRPARVRPALDWNWTLGGPPIPQPRQSDPSTCPACAGPSGLWPSDWFNRCIRTVSGKAISPPPPFPPPPPSAPCRWPRSHRMFH